MPNVVLKYKRDLLTVAQLRNIGREVRIIVAKYCSIEGVELSDEDIDWDPVMLEEAAIMADFSMRIETYDYEPRLTKLTKEVTLAMKGEIADVVETITSYRPADEPWLWVVYVSQHGHHV